MAKLAELKNRYQQILEELESYESSEEYQKSLMGPCAQDALGEPVPVC